MILQRLGGLLYAQGVPVGLQRAGGVDGCSEYANVGCRQHPELDRETVPSLFPVVSTSYCWVEFSRLQLTIPLPATTVQLPCIPLYPAHEPQNNKERSANSCENRYRPKDSHHLDVESMQMGCGVLATNGSHGGRRRRFGEAEHCHRAVLDATLVGACGFLRPACSLRRFLFWLHVPELDCIIVQIPQVSRRGQSLAIGAK